MVAKDSSREENKEKGRGHNRSERVSTASRVLVERGGSDGGGTLGALT